MGISTKHKRMLARLDDGFPTEDSVVRELNYFIGHEQRTIDRLVDKGPVELVPGRELQFWFRLMDKVPKVREEGEA